MGEGHQRQAWEHTAAIISIIANANRDPKEAPHPFKPDDFNPYYAEETSAQDEVFRLPLSFLKPLFVKPEK